MMDLLRRVVDHAGSRREALPKHLKERQAGKLPILLSQGLE